MKLVRWTFAAVARLLALIIHLLRLPFLLVGAACQAVDDALQDLTHDLRAACPWPWITEFRRKWEDASHQERERMIKNMKRHAS